MADTTVTVQWIRVAPDYIVHTHDDHMAFTVEIDRRGVPKVQNPLWMRKESFYLNAPVDDEVHEHFPWHTFCIYKNREKDIA
jgi:L-ascorbate metabolism protein UlaG (beta-lactamase superfamily)